ncbi:accessory factor UbiK family protein [Methylonatrum kenyense]|uniref:ubiquinone biosynthesis accessory factor UbiK n=1 Tax=Methylonatrum kenyense TaxID=455253 RepID=UPI0020BEC5FA|nr:accessory factor UbiK family protein [Methylonatrum kenyense]MCK8515192.1 accessory factor UbiK family protein [Methylonatrum kenyense]
MLDPKTLDDLARRFSESLPEGVRELQQEVERNVRSSLQSTFNRLDLVTREEFDAQSKVLARTRNQLEAMEARLRALEGSADGEQTEEN